MFWDRKKLQTENKVCRLLPLCFDLEGIINYFLKLLEIAYKNS